MLKFTTALKSIPRKQQSDGKEPQHCIVLLLTALSIMDIVGVFTSRIQPTLCSETTLFSISDQ